MKTTQTTRAREIVALAAKKAADDDNAHNAAWFREDRTGYWEVKAAALLEQTADKAYKLGMFDDAVNNELATYLCILAVEWRDECTHLPGAEVVNPITGDTECKYWVMETA